MAQSYYLLDFLKKCGIFPNNGEKVYGRSTYTMRQDELKIRGTWDANQSHSQ